MLLWEFYEADQVTGPECFFLWKGSGWLRLYAVYGSLSDCSLT